MKSKISIGISVSAILVAMALSGCGVAKQMSSDCGGEFEMGCKQLFGDSEADVEHEQSQDAAVSNLQTQIQILTTQINGQISAIEILSAEANVQHSGTTVLQSQINGLQAQVTSQQAQLAALNLGDPVVAYLDCGGDGPGFDEVVLRTKSGNLVAYFKDNGSREFLTLLVPGSYQTTDESKCNFSVTSTGAFCDSLGCR